MQVIPFYKDRTADSELVNSVIKLIKLAYTKGYEDGHDVMFDICKMLYNRREIKMYKNDLLDEKDLANLFEM